MTCSNPVTAVADDVDAVEALSCCEESGTVDPPVPDGFVAVVVHLAPQDIEYRALVPIGYQSPRFDPVVPPSGGVLPPTPGTLPGDGGPSPPVTPPSYGHILVSA